MFARLALAAWLFLTSLAAALAQEGEGPSRRHRSDDQRPYVTLFATFCRSSNGGILRCEQVKIASNQSDETFNAVACMIRGQQRVMGYVESYPQKYKVGDFTGRWKCVIGNYPPEEVL